ncbi:ImmA/IrrE family metallo-endopeptidase [Pantoea sp. JGM49]|uniref:ImmA/IrrE family metallo-endopeptidase n=1 Tax=unclassified Pantoea TaxID=2630326 RepID=UPI001BA5B49E|nr:MULTISPECIES: ImmA/IrrE family metallo-endopeptidase [unclassified Pantoea]MBS0882176.1 ImmA/IrrE family metallo-endopeptidase [Pantoea sp. JGM49]
MAFLKGKMKEKVKSLNESPLNEYTLNSPAELLDFADKNNIRVIPLDVSSLTKLLGITMRMEPMKGDESGSLKRGKDGVWVMTINSLHHPHRQRFTIAHELAHFIKHTIISDEFNDSVFFRDGKINKIETEANKFAAELLMPETDFHNFINEKSKTVEDIALYFQVSSMAVRLRAKQLGYKGHNL